MENKQPQNHEEFMREVSKQTLVHLIEVENNVKAIKGWITFLGIMILLSALLGLFW